MRPSRAFVFVMAGGLLAAGSNLAGTDGTVHAMAEVRAAMPRHPLRISGELQTLDRFGDVANRLNVELCLRWGDTPPTAGMVLRDAFGREKERLRVHYPAQGPAIADYARGDPPLDAPLPAPGDRVAGTAFTRGDLLLDFLWWETARVAGRERIRGRDTQRMDVQPPAGADTPYASVRLWIDTETSALLRAEGRDAGGNLLRRLSVESFRRVDGLWTIGNLDVECFSGRLRTRLRVRDVVVETPPDGGASGTR